MAARVHVSYPADGVGLLLLDDPPHNFGSYELLEGLHDGLQAVRSAGARVVVLASDVPGYLLAHASLPDIIDAYTDPESVSGDPRLWRRITEELERGPLVSISCNHAQAWGGGAEIAWACNLRTASPSATYAQIETVLGVVPGAGGTVRLARLTGQSKAMEILLTGEPVSATELERHGIVNRVFPDAELRGRTIAWASLIATRPQRGLQACKRTVLQAWDLPYEDGLRIEGYVSNSTMRADAFERIKQAQAVYDAGGDSWEAFGLDRPPSRPSP